MRDDERGKLDEFEAERDARWSAMGMPDVGSRYWDRNTEPMSFADWAEAFEDLEYRTVARDQIGDLEVSTIWLGLDHSFLPESRPLIFETMIFDCSTEAVAEMRERMKDWPSMAETNRGAGRYQERYSTEEEAIRGHGQAIVAAKAGLIDLEANI